MDDSNLSMNGTWWGGRGQTPEGVPPKTGQLYGGERTARLIDDTSNIVHFFFSLRATEAVDLSGTRVGRTWQRTDLITCNKMVAGREARVNYQREGQTVRAGKEGIP